MPPSGDKGGVGAGAGGCPFAGAATAAAGAAPPTTCPVAAAPATAATSAQPPTTTAGVCPFGFGAGGSGKGGAASTPLHCPLCRSLLFDCRAAKPCGHKACAECLSRFRDCPLCGADVEGSEADASAQGMVDAFLGAHGVYPDAVAAALDMGPLMQELMAMSGVVVAEGGGGANSGNNNKAALTAALLHGVALRSYAGGNVSAALARFEAAREALVRVLDEEEKEEKKTDGGSGGSGSKAALALGMVLGGLGDCHNRRGNASAAEASYRASAERLAGVAGVDLAQKQKPAAAAAATPPPPSAVVEARRALGVTLNKLGDLAYAKGDIAGALKQYHQALELRRARLLEVERAAAASDAADARLDLAAALIKAGDAAARGPSGPADEPLEPAACFAEARALLQAVGGGGDGEEAAEEGGGGPPPATLDRAQKAKRDRLLDALAAVQPGS